MKYDVFISYRREGGYDTAKHLNDLLVRDGYNVSFDIDTLRNGDFDTQLLDRIEQCKDFILIGKQLKEQQKLLLGQFVPFIGQRMARSISLT